MVTRVLAVLLLVWSVAVPVAHAEEVRVAVAANFTATMQSLARQFEAQSGHKVVTSFGSSGKLYTQIANGAPFDLFLSADDERPAQLEREGLTVQGTRFTYALGRLALWSSDNALVVGEERVLNGDHFKRLAIANPKTAPYGSAAMEVLKKLGQDGRLAPRLVQGDNIAQTYQFVATGNAQLGFVAYAQVKERAGGSWWLVPQSYHTPIRQDGALLTRGSNNRAARELLAYLRSATARKLIEQSGYSVE